MEGQFSLLQTSAVVGLLVQWLKLFLRMLETQAGLCLLRDRFGFGREGVSTYLGGSGLWHMGGKRCLLVHIWPAAPQVLKMPSEFLTN